MLSLLTFLASAAFFYLVLSFSSVETVVAVALVAAFAFLPPVVEDVIARVTNRRPIRDSKHYERQEFCYTFLVAASLIYILPDWGELRFIALLVASVLTGKAVAQLTLGKPGIKQAA
ncbi:hypothetical protein [Novipirellula sp.]|uniref:hypothetical protein n=1 Tax=Novipirellula sp. TaxID=2795430 RepID=UPI00356A97CC